MQEVVDRRPSIIDDNLPIEKENYSIWRHLVGKPSQEDIDYDISQSSDPQHVPMTTRKEIWAWYLFDISRTPLIIVMLSLVFPVYLSIVATRYGCKHNTPNGCDYYDNPILSSSSTLVVYIGNWSLKPESFATLMISLSGVFQAIGYLWISSIADYSTYQTFLFRFSTIIGDAMVIAFFFIPEQNWILIGIFGALLLVPIGLAAIFYNAYLPVLVENHWLIRRLKIKYENNNREHDIQYENQYQCLLRSIQDEISQFGFAVGYIGSFIAAAFAGVGFFFLEDITTQITNTYGITNSNNIVIDTFENEYWMKPIIGIDIWYANINITNINTSQIIYSNAFINGMKFNYGEIFQNGSVYGITNDTEFIIDYNTDFISMETEFIHSHYMIDNNDIIQINLYENANMINGIEFVMNNNNNSIYAGNISGINVIEVKPDNYPSYELGGYKISTGIYSDINNNYYNISIPIIYGYSFAFMDINKGQYGSTIDNRLIFSMCGVWSLIFAIPAFIILKSRKKDKILPTSSSYKILGRCPSICTVSFKDYYQIICDATRYPNLFKCLIAWFVWSDAENTTASIGILFGQNDLGMNSVQLLLLLLEIQLLAVLGNIFFIWFQNKFNLSSKNLLVLHLIINCFLPLWAIFGLFSWSPIGLLHIWEMYVMVGIFYASQLGSLFSTSRSLYAHLIPFGKESQFFGLYEFTNKGSSWIGPLLATLISNSLDLRYAIIYILVFYIIAIPILQFGVNYQQGMVDAGKISKMNIDFQKPLLIADDDNDTIDSSNTNKDTMDGQASIVSGFNVETHSYGST